MITLLVNSILIPLLVALQVISMESVEKGACHIDYSCQIEISTEEIYNEKSSFDSFKGKFSLCIGEDKECNWELKVPEDISYEIEELMGVEAFDAFSQIVKLDIYTRKNLLREHYIENLRMLKSETMSFQEEVKGNIFQCMINVETHRIEGGSLYSKEGKLLSKLICKYETKGKQNVLREVHFNIYNEKEPNSLKHIKVEIKKSKSRK